MGEEGAWQRRLDVALPRSRETSRFPLRDLFPNTESCGFIDVLLRLPY